MNTATNNQPKLESNLGNLLNKQPMVMGLTIIGDCL